jgi:hypothetical protein
MLETPKVPVLIQVVPGIRALFPFYLHPLASLLSSSTNGLGF